MLDLKRNIEHISLVHEYLNKKLKFDSQTILKNGLGWNLLKIKKTFVKSIA